MKKPLFFASAITLSAVLASCSGSPAQAPVVQPARTITSVAVTSSTATVQAGQSVTLTANVAGTGTFSKDLKWTVNPSAAGTLTTSGSSATFTATSDFSGQVTITATSAQDASKSGSVTLAVSQPDTTFLHGTPPTSARQIIGQITNWKRGRQLIETSPVVPPQAQTPRVRATIQPDGTFTLTLQSDAEIEQVLVPLRFDYQPCTSDISISDPSVLGVYAGFAALTSDEDYLTVLYPVQYEQTETLDKAKGQEYLYVDRPVHLSGTQTCIFKDNQGNVTATEIHRMNDVQLMRGWNVLDYSAQTPKSEQPATTTVDHQNGSLTRTLWIDSRAFNDSLNAQAVKKSFIQSLGLRLFR